MTTPDSTYAKPFLSIPEQIRRLRGRGMDCGSDAYAASVLERYGYYRLSGYWHLYRERPSDPKDRFDQENREVRLDTFVPGTKLSHVVTMYEFDQELRSRLSDVLSTVEISIRFFLGHRLGKANAFAHRNPELLGATRETETSLLSHIWAKVRWRNSLPHREPTKAYREWLTEYDRHEKRARDGFVFHFRKKYGPHLPIWVATEVMSFGVISNLYPLMRQSDQEVLAARFQVHAADGRGDRRALANWLNNLRHVRNICAHYGRLWNRTFDVLIDVPGQARKDGGHDLSRLADRNINNKLYGVLLILRHLLQSIAPDRFDVVDITDFIHAKSQDGHFSMGQLGFPDGWQSDPIWDRNFTLDRAPMLAASLLDRAESYTAPQAREALTSAVVKPSETPRTPEQEAAAKRTAQKNLLRTYLRFDVVIEIKVGQTKYYPKFQFRNGAIINALAEVNKTLTARCTSTERVQVSAALLDWWQTPHPALPKSSSGSNQSPCDLLLSESESSFSTLISTTDAMSTFVVPDPR